MCKEDGWDYLQKKHAFEGFYVHRAIGSRISPRTSPLTVTRLSVLRHVIFDIQSLLDPDPVID